MEVPQQLTKVQSLPIPSGSEAIGFLENMSRAPIMSQIVVYCFLGFMFWIAFKEIKDWKKKQNFMPDNEVADLEKTVASLKETLDRSSDQLQIYNLDFPKYNGELKEMQKDVSQLVKGQDTLGVRFDKFDASVSMQFEKGERIMEKLADRMETADVRLTNFMIEQARK